MSRPDPRINLELIRNLTAAASDNQVDEVQARIAELARKHAWTPEEMMDVIHLVFDSSKRARLDAFETAGIALRDTLGKVLR